MKIEESEKTDKHLDLDRELRKHWNVTVTVIKIVTGAFRSVLKGFVKRLKELKVGGRIKTI